MTRLRPFGIFEGYRRWRHTRGYGVHSPFAFRLVTNVVHPGDYSWYGYADIDRTFPDTVDRKVRREARMLLRLVAELRPRAVFLPSGAHPSFHAAIHAADSAIRILRKPKQAAEADMICTHGDFIPLDARRSQSIFQCLFTSNWCHIQNRLSLFHQLYTIRQPNAIFLAKLLTAYSITTCISLS